MAEAGEESTTKSVSISSGPALEEMKPNNALAEGGVTESARRQGYGSSESARLEKLPRPVRCLAHGEAGHGSAPTSD